MTVGSGVMTEPLPQQVLNEMAALTKELGFTTAHPTKHTFGSSWYGPTEDIQTCGKVALGVMQHVMTGKRIGSAKKFYDASSFLPEIASTVALPKCTQLVGGVDFQPSMLDAPAFTLDSASGHAILLPPTELAAVVYEPSNSSIPMDSTLGFALGIARRAMAPSQVFQNELTTGVNQSFVRAIVVYFPFVSYHTGQAELRWLHRSWHQMLRHQPLQWRTDLIVFSDHSSPLFDQLLCNSSFRQSVDEPDRCIVIDSYRPPAHHSSNVGILDVLAMKHPALSSYDWILRSDVGAIITPRFATWRPTAFSVSSPNEPYCVPNTPICPRLKRIAKDMALTAPVKREAFGSTWFGNYDNMRLEDLDVAKVNDYATYMALKSSRQYTNTNTMPQAFDNGLDESFVRAAVMYVPQTGEAGCRWFHWSWRAMAVKEPQLWRTDLVVFATQEWPFLRELNCTSVPRRSRAEPNRCIVVGSYKSVATTEFDFERADDTNILATTMKGVLDSYDWLLKTDIETIVTPAFATWKPDTFTFGSSGPYSFQGEPTSTRLQSIGASLNLSSPTVNDVGASWYGPASVVRSCASLSVRLMHHLHKYEFSAMERSREYYQVQAAGWPRWHYGVLHMYASHLAIPHCTNDTGGFAKNNDMMDFSTELKGEITDHPHLRAAQGTQRFSWREFAAGQYDSVDIHTLQAAQVADYALLLALESKRSAGATPLAFDNAPSSSRKCCGSTKRGST
ncbi:hypothetical protein H310_03591 [Aphanomyces invadans]|uniref:DUF7164 domain-containing protein n=1 Tax=Aphanomyces invadans TaxID=157072 RepID=A0A024UK41_9STRA|nr:hypothetical protein H310_03591 [Aphanomyces invadans]ETW05958.1 hypothetical protein H310_03591 [Aphanomyces invadans]|eukprot:XP_008865735.1 hypothetical protein H310_03591 [Aphanomyces invadans]